MIFDHFYVKVLTLLKKVINLCEYCLYISYSCGYQKAFDHYAQILGEKYPELNIEGANYDPSIMHLIGAKVLVMYTTNF